MQYSVNSQFLGYTKTLSGSVLYEGSKEMTELRKPR